MRADHVLARELEGELVLLDTQGRRYLTLNPTGKALWAPLVEGATLEALTEVLASTFEVEHDQARADTQTFLGDLEGLGLLEPVR